MTLFLVCRFIEKHGYISYQLGSAPSKCPFFLDHYGNHLSKVFYWIFLSRNDKNLLVILVQYIIDDS